MKRILQAIASIALLATIVPAVWFLVDRTQLSTVKLVMLLATIVWFAASPFAWQHEEDRRRQGADEPQD